jgi:hypothetical protein
LLGGAIYFTSSNMELSRVQSAPESRKPPLFIGERRRPFPVSWLFV